MVPTCWHVYVLHRLLMSALTRLSYNVLPRLANMTFAYVMVWCVVFVVRTAILLLLYCMTSHCVLLYWRSCIVHHLVAMLVLPSYWVWQLVNFGGRHYMLMPSILCTVLCANKTKCQQGHRKGYCSRWRHLPPHFNK